MSAFQVIASLAEGEVPVTWVWSSLWTSAAHYLFLYVVLLSSFH